MNCHTKQKESYVMVINFQINMKLNPFSVACLFLSLLFTLNGYSSIKFNLNLVRPWNKNEKNQFPTPLVAVFEKENKTLIFVGDHHANQDATYAYFESAVERFKPEIIVIENVDFKDGLNPQKWTSKYINKSQEELLKEGGIAPNAARLANLKKIPIIGGEPTIEEQMHSTFLLNKKYTDKDIRNVQILQRIPYRRDQLEIKNEVDFFKYAIKQYRVNEDSKRFIPKFKNWYKARSNSEFIYSKISKEETAVNCSVDDRFFQKVACDFNINRDRALVENIQKLLEKYNKVLVAYGTGHFVQEYLALRDGFAKEPEFFSPIESNELIEGKK